MLTIHTHPNPDPRLVAVLAGLLEPDTAAAEVADPALPARAALVVAGPERLLITIGQDINRADAQALLTHARQLDVTCLVLIDRNHRLREAVRRTLNNAGAPSPQPDAATVSPRNARTDRSAGEHGNAVATAACHTA